LFLFLVLVLVGCGSTKPEVSVSERDSGHSHDSSSSVIKTDTTATYGLAEQDKDWSSDRATMDKLLDDVAFVQQRPVLESFYADVVAIRDEHHKFLTEQDYKTLPTIGNAHWAVAVLAKVSLHVVLGFIDELPRITREMALNDITSFQPFNPDKLHVRTLPPALQAYLNAGQEVRDKYQVDVSRVSDVEERINNLPQDVARYIRQDDLLSAYVVIQHVDIIRGDIIMSLTPFEVEIYNKSHPAR
jgi:hypothetical protein